ncbi:AtpZ/AtpI family protein [Flavobacterium jejuense]|uniref:AtpZ/AtpI family protein n=1 Tax=Flavobacterium jejuense TaxID=1544455 RepID=A0ABX0IQ58_9FLAO|nr:AtpZ/AtpI family protein [Flavobacterium jejuense]NHN25701.1 AtpZ/AtpI family protein [Flavobacterium jejuense]
MKKNNYNKWLALITIPFQMGAVIFIFNYLGKLLDEKYQTTYYVKGVTLFGVFIALYFIIRQVNQINKEDK